MRKAEEIAVEAGLFKSIEAIKENFGLQITRDCYIGTSRSIINAIKKAQIEAIDAAVEKCIEDVQIYEYPYGNHCPTCGHTAFYVDNISILQVAEQLKKEL